METKDIFTLAGLSINAIGLIVALIKFSQEQSKANKLKQEEVDAKSKEAALQATVERRTEYKLRIYQSLIDDSLSFDELVSKFRQDTPTSEIDQIELRKCIYEMLVEGTLVTYEDRTYSANTIEIAVDEDEDEEEDHKPPRRQGRRQ